VRQVSKPSFFEKKDQKTTFPTLVHGALSPSTTNPLPSKVFCFFFSKKKRLPCLGRAA
jgi:hypothetical protein